MIYIESLPNVHESVISDRCHSITKETTLRKSVHITDSYIVDS